MTKDSFKDLIVVMPFQLPWDWSADYQRQTCLELAKHNLVIAYIHNDARFFLKGIPRRKFPKHKNILFYQPRFPLPLRRFRLIEQWNHLLNIAYLTWRYGGKGKKLIIWIFDVVFWFYPNVRCLNSKIISLYDCVDFVWNRDKNTRQKIQSMEKKLIANADYFFVNSIVLYALHQQIRKPNAIVPQGFRLDDFKKPIRPTLQFPNDKPIIGFVGAINHRLDFRLITRLAKQNPKLYFVLWGKIQETELTDEKETARVMRYLGTFPNVILGYSTSTGEIPGIITQFNIGIIPYRISLLSNRYCFPMKLFEYFYMGKPVISTSIIEVKKYSDFVAVGRNIDEWEMGIHRFLNEKWQNKQKDHQLKIALENSWEKKVNKIFKVLIERPAVLKRS